MTETYIVRVDTPTGQRKTYFFDSLEEANAFIIECTDTLVEGPSRTIGLTADEDF